MSARNGRVVRLRRRSYVGEELMGAADAIADMAQRVQLNGPEPVYASEKLGHALYKAAEGLALRGVELHEVDRGGASRPRARDVDQRGGAVSDEQHADKFTAFPASNRDATLRVTIDDRAVVVSLRHAEASAGVRLTRSAGRDGRAQTYV